MAMDSEDKYQSEMEDQHGSGNENPWDEFNVNKSKIKQQKANECTRLKPLFNYTHDRAIRDKIDVEILTKK